MMDGFFGWKDAKTSRIYTRQKQQAKLARQADFGRIDWGESGTCCHTLGRRGGGSGTFA